MPDSCKRLSGKHALVTGAGRGIGSAIARRLASEGARVACGVRAEGDADNLVAAIEKAGGSAITVVLDVTDPASVATAVERSSRPDRRIDILVNNAGIGGLTPLDGDERSDIRWAEIIEVNLTGSWRVCRAALPFLPSGSRIINLSSVTGRFGVPQNAAYCAAKHGVIGLTRSLALELAPRRITVNAICPGWVNTDMGRGGMRGYAKAMGAPEEEGMKMAAAMTPLGSVLEPEEIGGLAAYLASEDARHITGQAVVLDGGQIMP